jgi:hypothetical protein
MSSLQQQQQQQQRWWQQQQQQQGQPLANGSFDLISSAAAATGPFYLCQPLLP